MTNWKRSGRSNLDTSQRSPSLHPLDFVQEYRKRRRAGPRVGEGPGKIFQAFKIQLAGEAGVLEVDEETVFSLEPVSADQLGEQG